MAPARSKRKVGEKVAKGAKVSKKDDPKDEPELEQEEAKPTENKKEVAEVPPVQEEEKASTKDKKNTKSNVNDEKKKEVNESGKKYWLLKSEPETRMHHGVDVKFGVEDLKAKPDQTSVWDGIRNHQSRNFLRDEIKVGDQAFFYHSNCKQPGIVGVVDIVKSGYPDASQFDSKSNYYDSKSTEENPKWFSVDVKFNRMLKRYIPLPELKDLYLQHKKNKEGALKLFGLITKPRLSVLPVTKEEFEFILTLEEK